jgi:hypothetical protein
VSGGLLAPEASSSTFVDEETDPEYPTADAARPEAVAGRRYLDSCLCARCVDGRFVRGVFAVWTLDKLLTLVASGACRAPATR